MTGPDEPIGLQRQRTILAWNRTALSMAAVGVLLGRFAAANPWSVRSVPAAVGIGTGAWLAWVTAFRPGGLEHPDGGRRLRYKRTTTVAVVAVFLHVSALVLLFENHVNNLR